jgi:hypothetical protein
MSGTTVVLGSPRGTAPLLSRARIVAQPGFNRWLVPPAALSTHLCIGMIYGMSVFWLPLTHVVGVACPAGSGLLHVRWSHLVGQFGGRAKLGSGFFQAASRSVVLAAYASSGVLPARVEWGRPPL